jgi:hypothetical protein
LQVFRRYARVAAALPGHGTEFDLRAVDAIHGGQSPRNSDEFILQPSSYPLALEPVLDPLLAVEIYLAQQEGETNTTGHAVVPASQGEIDQLSASDYHMMSPADTTPISVRIHRRHCKSYLSTYSKINISTNCDAVGTEDSLAKAASYPT